MDADYLSVPDAAAKLGVGETTLRRWIRSGRFPCRSVKIGAHWRIYARDVNDLVPADTKFWPAALVELAETEIARADGA